MAARKSSVLLRSFVEDHVIIKVYTKCDAFLLAYSTYRGVDRIFNMRILLSVLQKELI